MRGLLSSLSATVGVIIAMAVVARSLAGAGQRERPPPCPPGRYLLSEPLVAGASPLGAVVDASEASVSLDGVCDSIAPRKYKGGRKGTKVKALWRACTGLEGKVRLKGKIVEECTTLRGRIKARKFRRRVEAPRSVCGDGVVDRGGGEDCEPPGTATCDVECRTGVTIIVGPAGGRVNSLDGHLTLDFPPGALAAETEVTVRRLGPEDLPQSLIDEGASVGYLLLPAGLQLGVPATATFDLGASPASPNGVSGDLVPLFTANGDGSGIESLENLTLVLDGPGGTTAMSGTLTHFSIVYPNDDQRLGSLEAAVQPGTFVPVGTSITVDLTLTLNHQDGAPVNAGHVNQTPPGGVLDYTGPLDPDFIPILNIPQGMVKKQTIAGYSCFTVGNEPYQAIIQGQAIFTVLRIGLRRGSFVIKPIVDVFCTGSTTTSTSLPAGTTTSVTTSTSTSSTSSSSTSSSTSSSSTTTTSTSSSSSTTVPCMLDTGQSPPICNGGCGPTDICIANAAGACECRPVAELCGQPPGEFVCQGGLCLRPSDVCGQLEQTAPCTCAPPCALQDPGPPTMCGGGLCPPGQECVTSGDVCTCQPFATSTSTSSSSTTSTSSSTSSSTSPSSSTTTTTVPSAECRSLDGTACGGQCPGDQLCRALESRTGGGCLCVPPGSACPEGQAPDPGLGVCGGLCPREDQLCAENGSGTCVCADCRLFDVGGTPVCFGGCAGQFETCAAIGGGCACVPNSEFCQPQGAGMCNGYCPGPLEECMVSGSGCACAQP